MNPYEPSDSRYDLWPTRDVTPSDRPQRYAAYKRKLFLDRNGLVFAHLDQLAYCRKLLAYWKRRDPHSSTVRLARDVFYDRLDELREMSGPALPGSAQPALRRAA